MSELRTIYGHEVVIEKVKADVVAIGDGYSVTVQIVLDQDDILVAHTVARAQATLEQATGEMIPEAVAWTSAWITEHADAVPA